MTEPSPVPFFTPVFDSVLVRVKGGAYKEMALYVMDGALFLRNGASYYRMLREGRTSTSTIEWLRFSSGREPHVGKMGYLFLEAPVEVKKRSRKRA